MKFFSPKPLLSVAAVLAAVTSVSVAHAGGWDVCNGPCSQAKQYAYTSSKSYYTTQQTNYCNGLTDPAARSSCLAAVPAVAEQQAQTTATNVYNQCMSSCMATP